MSLSPRSARRSRLALTVLVLAALALSACGRSTPDITAEDGRDLEAPSDEIWVPEVRHVEDEPRERDVEDVEADEVRSAAAATAEEEADTDGAGRDAAPSGDRGARGGQGESAPSGPSSPRDGDGGAADGTSPDGEHADDTGADDAGADDDEDEDEPSEPEVVGDCGVPADGTGPDDEELAAAVDALRERLEEDWPDTHAGAWLVEDEERTRVHVGFTEQVRAALEILCDDFDHPQLLVGVRTELSDAELRALADEVVAERDALRDGEPAEDLPEVIRRTEGRYAVAVDAAANGLRIAVEDPTEPLRDAFRGRYTPRLALVAGTVGDDGEVVEDETTADPDAENEPESGARG